MAKIYNLRELEVACLGIPCDFFSAQTMSYGCSGDGKGRSIQIYVDGNDVPYRYCGSTNNERPVIEDMEMNTPKGQVLAEYLKRRGNFNESPYELNECLVL